MHTGGDPLFHTVIHEVCARGITPDPCLWPNCTCDWPALAGTVVERYVRVVSLTKGTRPTADTQKTVYFSFRRWNEHDFCYDDLSGPTHLTADDELMKAYHHPPFTYVTNIRRL